MSIHSTDRHGTDRRGDDLRGAGLFPVRVQVGIDAAVVANHHVCVRETLPDGGVRLTRFLTPPTLAGLRVLGDRLGAYPGVVAVAEPTSMTWLGLSIALRQAGADLSLIGARHAARLRGAIIGKDKSDVIDADVLATAGEVFTLTPLRPPSPAELALRRAVTRRGKLVIDGNRARRRLISLALGDRVGPSPTCGPRSRGRCRPRSRS